MSPFVRCLLVVMLLHLTLGVCPAVAQVMSPGIFHGLFGGASPVAGKDVLDLTASGFAAYVQDIVPPGEAALPSSSFEGANASLTYQHSWKHATLGAFGNGGTSYFNEPPAPDQSQWVNRWAVGADGGFDRKLSPRTTFSGAGSVGYSPYYGFGFAGPPGSGFAIGPDRIQSIPGLDYTVAKQPTLNSMGMATLSRALSSRSSLDFYYRLQNVSFLGDNSSTFGDETTQSVGARYIYSINKYVGVHAGYGFTRSTNSLNGLTVDNHNIDAGVDGGYGKEYKIAKRTTFAFNTRSGLFVGDTVNAGENATPTTRFFLGGDVSIAHRWGQTWQAEARADRSAGFVDGFQGPVFSNTATATVRGVPVPRIDFIATATYVSGDVGFATSNNAFGSTTGTAQLRFALYRNLAAFAQYFYYHYHFDSGVLLPGQVPPRLDRQGGSVGVTYWLPLF